VGLFHGKEESYVVQTMLIFCLPMSTFEGNMKMASLVDVITI
jgi:hypothetical protein